MSLRDLETTIHRELAYVAFPARDWVRSRKSKDNHHVYDVLIVGGGQSGISIAAKLSLESVRNVLIVDKNPAGFAGPWRTYARMKTLRTENDYPSLAMGIPSLSIQAWWEAQHGYGSWAKTGLTPTPVWADYLTWFQQFMKIDVKSDTTAQQLQWIDDEGFFEVTINGPSGSRIERARRVVDATGMQGAGDWQVPAFITDSLPKKLYYHTCEDIPFSEFKGKRVGVLGAGSSAFDNSVTALEHGASVDQFFRRETIIQNNLHRWIEFVGFLSNFSDQSNEIRYRYIRQFLRYGLPVTKSTEAAEAFPGFKLHASEGWTEVREVDGMAEVQTPRGVYRFDALICGTGFDMDLSKNHLYDNFVDEIASWGDVYSPPKEDVHEGLLRCPYVTSRFEMTEKVPGTCSYIRNIFNFTLGGWINHGPTTGLVGFKYAIPKLVAGITGSLFVEDGEAYFEDFKNYVESPAGADPTPFAKR